MFVTKDEKNPQGKNPVMLWIGDDMPVRVQDGHYRYWSGSCGVDLKAHNKLLYERFNGLSYDDDPVKVYLLDIPCEPAKPETAEVVKKLSDARDIDEALRICKHFENKCFQVNYPGGRTTYMKIYDVSAKDGWYVIARCNYIRVEGGRGTFDHENKYVFSCKDKSEYILWKMHRHTEAEYVEITEEAFEERAKMMFDRYMEEEIRQNAI